MYTKTDDELKPTTPPSCGTCGVPKKPVWVLKDKRIMVAIKCKCGIALLHQNEVREEKDK